MSSQTLNPSQLAQRWEISEKTLERWRKEGTGPVFIKLGALVRYRVIDIEAFESRGLRRDTATALLAVAGGI